MDRFFRSILFRVCISILTIKIVLLLIVGICLNTYFSRDLDREVLTQLQLPARLLSEQVLDISTFESLSSLSHLVGEHVTSAGVIDGAGKILAGTVSERIAARLIDMPSSELVTMHGGEDLALLELVSFADKPSVFVYIKVSGDRVYAEKSALHLKSLLLSLIVLLVSTIFEVLVVYRMVVPRIKRTSSVLRKIAEGDFSVRTGDTGPADQLGTMMQRVNMMISTIEAYTVKLKVLNSAAERFSLARNTEEIIDVATELIESQLPVRRQVNDHFDSGDSSYPGVADHYNTLEEQEIIFTLPIADDEDSYRVVPFVASNGYSGFATVDQDFIATLSRMVTVAVDRVTAFEEISNAESRYRHLFTSAMEGIIRISADGKILETNPAMSTMAGYESPADMVKEIRTLGQQLYRNSVDWDKVLTLVEEHEQILDYEVEFKRKDGTVFPVSISASVVRSDQGLVQAYDARIFDISERKRREKAERDHLKAEAINVAKTKVVDDLEWKNRQLMEAMNELKAAQIQLMQSEKMAVVGQTAGGVAHDLNNILSGVVGYPELLLTSLPRESELRQPLETILKSGKQAAAIVSDLMALTQDNLRKRRAVQLETLTSDVLQSEWCQQFLLEHQGVEVEISFADEPTMIYGFPSQLEKMLKNLLANSIFWLRGHGKVRISTSTEKVLRSTDAMGNEICDSLAVLRVENDGPAISENDLKNVFEPFYTRKVLGMQGTGLGLTVVWNVVDEHGGSIAVESSKELGTVFTIHLPADEGAVPQRLEEVSEAGYQAGRKILVIDDEQLQRDIARKMLERFGYEVEVCQSGEEAVEFLQNQSVDLIILDMLMPPGMNGLETYQQILDVQPRQKAIIVSGYAENKDVQRAMELGVGVYVKKPYTMHQIVQSVKRELQVERFRNESV